MEKKNPLQHTDLPDNDRDRKHLEPEETSIELPEVRDIPGQEHVHVPPLGELADTTASSADEEGEGLLDDLNGDENVTNDDSNVTNTERDLLDRAANETPGDEGASDLRRARLDSVDEDGDILNEKGFGFDNTGDDLDVPGQEDDDQFENAGAEDEENNAYSTDKNPDDDETLGIP
ncbi:hypothetical protein MKQ68_03095 [Chitinophaga horti]|uniref:Uncharacterized protein n=1 Tax=Chitinophaga horti TaxID=2920382 RepID=A0ABY6J704_9BACT|nr:hypothetical protein [Chitinophaga horti]UYQ94076.1 hypothetical protein MKQ68_03095 [Chitinophaga horti]